MIARCLSLVLLPLMTGCSLIHVEGLGLGNAGRSPGGASGNPLVAQAPGANPRDAWAAAVKANPEVVSLDNWVNFGILPASGELAFNELRPVWQARERLAPLAADCAAGKFSGAVTSALRRAGTNGASNEPLKADDVCPYLQNPERIKKLLTTAVAARAEQLLKDSRRELEITEQSQGAVTVQMASSWPEGLKAPLADFRKEVEGEGLGAAMDTAQQGLDALSAKWDAYVARQLKAPRSPAGAKDAAAESLLRKQTTTTMASVLPGAQVKTVSVQPNWVVARDTLGVVLQRTRQASVVVTVPGKPYCLEVKGAVIQHAQSQVKFDAVSTSALFGFTEIDRRRGPVVVRCP